VVALDLHQRQTWHPVKVGVVPREERKVVKEGNSRNQAVGHPARSPCAIKIAPKLCGTLGSGEIQGKNVEGVDELPDLVTALPFLSAAQQFETSNGGGPEPVRLNILSEGSAVEPLVYNPFLP
jgi:hypothetical protein